MLQSSKGTSRQNYQTRNFRNANQIYFITRQSLLDISRREKDIFAIIISKRRVTSPTGKRKIFVIQMTTKTHRFSVEIE